MRGHQHEARKSGEGATSRVLCCVPPHAVTRKPLAGQSEKGEQADQRRATTRACGKLDEKPARALRQIPRQLPCGKMETHQVDDRRCGNRSGMSDEQAVAKGDVAQGGAVEHAYGEHPRRARPGHAQRRNHQGGRGQRHRRAGCAISGQLGASLDAAHDGQANGEDRSGGQRRQRRSVPERRRHSLPRGALGDQEPDGKGQREYGRAEQTECAPVRLASRRSLLDVRDR